MIKNILIWIGFSFGWYLASFIVFDGIRNKRDWLYHPEKHPNRLFMPSNFSVIRRIWGVKGVEIYLLFWAIVGLIAPVIMGLYLVYKYWPK